MVVLVYWVSFLVLIHTWFLYGATLWLLFRLKARQSTPPLPDPPPMITVIVAAHNEEDSIRPRLENLRSLRYDLRRIEVLVASDGSTDATQRIVREVRASWDGVKLLDFSDHRGRAAVHNDAVLHARGEILVFTDAATRFDRDFLQHIVPHFQIPSVGAASGRIFYLNESDSSIALSAGVYWHLEERLRTWESALGILAFGTGAAFCVRKDLYEPIKPNEDIDYALSMQVVARGYRVSYESEALAYDLVTSSLGNAHVTRIRQTSRASRGILRNLLRLSSLWKSPGVLLSIISHKVLRHLTPFLLISLWASNALLLSWGSWYRLTFTLQCGFYILALLGWIAYLRGWKPRPLALPLTFAMLNFSRMIGFLNGLFRKPPDGYR